MKGTIQERLEAKYMPEPNSGCWIWTASLDGKGYGQLMCEGLPRRAHRLSYEIYKGSIPSGLDLDHLCRMRCCINPDHLEPVTRATNINRGVRPDELRAEFLAITHCPQGHEYTTENTIIKMVGPNKKYKNRQCRECRRNYERLRRARFLKREQR